LFLRLPASAYPFSRMTLFRDAPDQ
jgi:hypothetical protein